MQADPPTAIVSEIMNEHSITVNGVTLCTETFGDPGNPAVLLIMGATVSMLGWDDRFCRRLAVGGRYVIRYDHRDTGRSDTYEPGKPQYMLQDMADDAVGVLDAHRLAQAHFVGMSLGGMIAQLVAIQYPNRLATLTLIASSPHGPEDPDLPPMAEKVQSYFAPSGGVDWSNEASVVDFLARGAHIMTGSMRAFDETAVRSLVIREMGRESNYASRGNHALIASDRWRERLGEIRVPTLVVHGSDDPVLPYGHGVALAKEIPGATLLTIEGMGHELHPADWDTIVRAILQHTA